VATAEARSITVHRDGKYTLFPLREVYRVMDSNVFTVKSRSRALVSRQTSLLLMVRVALRRDLLVLEDLSTGSVVPAGGSVALRMVIVRLGARRVTEHANRSVNGLVHFWSAIHKKYSSSNERDRNPKTLVMMPITTLCAQSACCFPCRTCIRELD